MELKLTLALPRDEYSVPVARRVLSRSLEVLGVDESVVADIELALTEACTNVLDHAADTDEYEVSAGIDGTICIIEVIDRGEGFDGNEKGHAVAEASAEVVAAWNSAISTRAASRPRSRSSSVPM